MRERVSEALWLRPEVKQHQWPVVVENFKLRFLYSVILNLNRQHYCGLLISIRLLLGLTVKCSFPRRNILLTKTTISSTLTSDCGLGPTYLSI